MLSTVGFADTLVLRSGRTIDGTVLMLGGTPREIRMDVGGKIQSFSVSDVSSVSFGSTPEPGAKPTPETSQPDLTGTWTGIETDPNTGNPFKVTIEIAENHQNDVVATMVGPWGVYLPSGTVAFSGTHNDDRFPVTVLCRSE